jgi:hypothetical protein
MDREAFSMKDLSIDELTTQAMQLLSIHLADLYAVLGFQLIAYSRPARLATLISYHTSLQKVLAGQDRPSSTGVAAPLGDLSNGLAAVYEELKGQGIQFIEGVREELANVLCTTESLELADRATASSIQVMVVVIAGALRMPPQTESLAATIAAIICKSGLKEFCQVKPAKTIDPKTNR